VAHFEFLMASSLVDAVILSVAVLQAERRISRYDAVCHGRSLGPLVKTRALRDDALRDSEFNLSHYLNFSRIDSGWRVLTFGRGVLTLGGAALPSAATKAPF